MEPIDIICVIGIIVSAIVGFMFGRLYQIAKEDSKDGST